MTPKKRCFIIMPFGKYGTPEYDRNMKIYQLMIKPVVEKCGYESIRADELEHVGSITKDIIELLHGSELVIADLTGKNANVFYELGVRHVLYRCGTIPIIRQGESLPFDIANYRAIFYTSELDGPELFKNELEMRIKAFEKYQTEKSDNPVHDTLGDSLQYVNLKDYVSLSDYKAKQQEIDRIKKEHEKLNQQYKTISSDDKQLKKKIDEFDREKTRLNETIKKLEQQLKQAQQAASKKKKDMMAKTPIDLLNFEFDESKKDDIPAPKKKWYKPVGIAFAIVCMIIIIGIIQLDVFKNADNEKLADNIPQNTVSDTTVKMNIQKPAPSDESNQNIEPGEIKKKVAPDKADDSQQKQVISKKHKESVSKPPVFRPQPKELTSNDVKKMLKDKNLFDSDWNKSSKGFDNNYELMTKKGEQIVYDHASGLMWQQSGSSESMNYENAKKWIDDRNREGYAGYNDWRLPTLEEAMSLMEPKENNEGLYIDPVFDKTQGWIWTSDMVKGESWAWVVSFVDGGCDDYFLFYDLYVRAVRSGQSSVK